MATYKDYIEAEIVVDNVRALSQLEEMEKAGMKAGTAMSKGLDVTPIMEKVRGEFGANSKELAAYNLGMQEAADKAEKMAKKFDMNNLSLLFGGMMLQRFGQTLVKLVLPAMGEFNTMNHKGVKQMNAMNASVKFLQFSLFDTFSQTSMFRNFVEFVIHMSEKLSEMVANNPKITELFASVGGIALALGGLSIAGSFLGQMEQLGRLLGPAGIIVLGLALITGYLTRKYWDVLFEIGGTVGTAIMNIFKSIGSALESITGIPIDDLLVRGLAAAALAVNLMATGMIMVIALAEQGGRILATGMLVVFQAVALIMKGIVSSWNTITGSKAGTGFLDSVITTAAAMTDDIKSKGLTSWDKQMSLIDGNIASAKTLSNIIVNGADAGQKALTGQTNPALQATNDQIMTANTGFDSFKSNVSNFKPQPIYIDVVYRETNKPSSVKSMTSSSTTASKANQSAGTPANYNDALYSQLNSKFSSSW